MSSDNEDTYEDFDDYSDNDDIIIDDDDDDVQINDVQPSHQAPPPPIPTTRQTRQSTQHPQGHAQGQGQAPLQGYLPPGAFQAGFGGNAFARPPASMFRRGYRAFSTAILEVQQGRGHLGGGSGRSNLMYGGKIVMPASALHELTQMEIELPITFEITNPALPDLITHVGVLEFIADEGTVNLPQWIMDQLRLNEGDPIRIVGGRYPKGQRIKIQPQSVDFLEISDPKSVLEQAMRNFSVLTAGDIIEIGYQSITFRLLIMETLPADTAISVLDTDLEVDFAAPLGYVEPEYKPRGAVNVPTMKDKFSINTESKQDVDAKGSGANTPRSAGGGDAGEKAWEAFKGSGNSLAGKRIKGKGVSVKKIEPVTEGSRIQRTDQPRIITADTQIGGRQVPAALNLPFGHLFFGFNPQPPQGMVGPEGEAQEPLVPFAGVGNGNTLSGRAARPILPSAESSTGAAALAPAKAAVGEPRKAFGGQGQSLSGRKLED